MLRSFLIAILFAAVASGAAAQRLYDPIFSLTTDSQVIDVYAVGGSPSYKVVDYIRDGTTTHTYDMWIFEAGINDVAIHYCNIPQMMSIHATQLSRAASLATLRSTKLFIQGLQPVDADNLDRQLKYKCGSTSAPLAMIRDQITTFGQMSGASVIEVYEAMLPGWHYEPGAYCRSDGVHLTPEGNEALARELWRGIRSEVAWQRSRKAVGEPLRIAMFGDSIYVAGHYSHDLSPAGFLFRFLAFDPRRSSADLIWLAYN